VSLIVTPQLLKSGLRLTQRHAEDDARSKDARRALGPAPKEAIVVGLGPMGRQAASQLETAGVDVCLVDLSPVNLYDYAQQGFRTISGNARERDVLERADAANCRLAVISVPEDRAACQIVRTLRGLNRACTIVVRCRYQVNIPAVKKAGASAVVSEEAEASGAVLRLLRSMDSA